jgi:hypothetical protein
MLEPIVVTPSSATSSISTPPSPLLFPSRHLSINSGINIGIENRGDGGDSIGTAASITFNNNNPPSRKISTISTRKTSSPSRVFSSVSKFMTLDFSSTASRRLSQLLPPRTNSSSTAQYNNGNGGKRSMSSRLSAGQMSVRRFSGTKKDTIQTGGSTMSTGRSLLAATLRAKFRHDSHDDSESDALVTHLDKYTEEELQEYRQVFNMFDAGLLPFLEEIQLGKDAKI